MNLKNLNEAKAAYETLSKIALLNIFTEAKRIIFEILSNPNSYTIRIDSETIEDCVLELKSEIFEFDPMDILSFETELRKGFKLDGITEVSDNIGLAKRLPPHNLKTNSIDVINNLLETCNNYVNHSNVLKSNALEFAPLIRA